MNKYLHCPYSLGTLIALTYHLQYLLCTYHQFSIIVTGSPTQEKWQIYERKIG